MFVVILAEFGNEAANPKVKLPVPEIEAPAVTSRLMLAPSLKIFGTLIPAPGIGAENSSLD